MRTSISEIDDPLPLCAQNSQVLQRDIYVFLISLAIHFIRWLHTQYNISSSPDSPGTDV